MKLESAIQEALVALLCYDDGPRGAKFVRVLVPPNTFDPYYREIAREADAYYAKYKTPAGEHTLDIIESLKARTPDAAPIYDKIFHSLLEVKDTPGFNPEYILSRAITFARFQRQKAALSKAMETLERETPECVDEVDGIFAAASKPFAGADVLDTGLLLNDPQQALRFLDSAHEQVFPCGVDVIDKLGYGPIRGGSHLFMAPSGYGKTWWAISCGVNAMVTSQAKVLHVTLEMSEIKIAARYLQTMFSIGKKDARDIATKFFVLDELGRFAGTEVQYLKRPHMKQADIREFLTAQIKPLATRPRLYIKQFPSGQLTVRRLEAYLSHLEAVANFIPDLLIVDYADLFDLSVEHKREAIGKVHVDLRGMAQERNLALVNLTQSNRDALSARRVSAKHVAEDKTKIDTADTVISFSQTEAEYELGLARLFIVKAREEPRNTQVLISQQYSIGQFAIDSCQMIESKYWPTIEGTAEAE